MCELGHLETLEVFLKSISETKIIHWGLACASFKGQSKVVARLLEYPGVDINSKVAGSTFLFWASRKGDLDTINQLLNAGANVHDGSVGDTHIDQIGAVKPLSSTGSPASCLHGLLQYLDVGLSDKLPKIYRALDTFLKAGIDVNRRNGRGDTALHLVASSAALARLLLSHGADAALTNHLGFTPLHYTIYPKVVSILVEEGKASVHAKSLDGRTPLHCATERSVPMMRKLLEYSMDLTAMLWIETATACSTFIFCATGVRRLRKR